jgi:hypothetical protein
MKTGRRDSTESYGAVVEDFIPNHNDSISLVLSRFQSIGVDVEGTVALLGTDYQIILTSNKYKPNSVIFFFCFCFLVASFVLFLFQEVTLLAEFTA